jgi:hypothetical protein
MWCCKCNKDIVDCVCPDIEERLRNLAENPVVAPAAIQNLEARKIKQERIARTH